MDTLPSLFYVGTYTEPPFSDGDQSEGVCLYRMDAATGQIQKLAGFNVGPNPSFLALHPAGAFLYVVNETRDGMVSAFSIGAEDGELTFLNRQKVVGDDPCYLTVDPSGRWLLVACYSSGSLSVLPISPDGRLGSLVQRVQHEGHGINPRRQEMAHAHSIRFDPSGGYALSADLGMDRVWVYRQDPLTGQITPHTPPGLDLKPGSGPRHLEFHPDGRFLYIANELDSTVTACAWDPATGKLAVLETLSTLPAGITVDNTVADIHITPSGRFLYVSNRGHNSLAAFAVHPEDGRLRRVGFYPSGGDWPRNFAITPDGVYALVANQNSGELVVLRIEADGALARTPVQTLLPAPVCVQFLWVR